jgi:hypothetical protein
MPAQMQRCAICGLVVPLYGGGGPVLVEYVRCARCAGELAGLPEEEGQEAA